jgi:hypothetical protein
MKSPLLFLAAAMFSLAACDTGGSADTDSEISTWSLIQSEILVPKCTEACHSAGTPVVAQSGLILTSDVSYDQLVGVTPTNTAASKAGLLRVHTTAASDLHQSFLWEKINAPEQDHLLDEHPEYGSIMPLGAGPLSYGELSFIRRWILAGAPEDGVVADPIILTDTATFRAAIFEPLPVLAPDEGLSVRLGPFEVPAQFEREFFYRIPDDFTETRLVKRTTMSMASGSHHFIVYSYPESTPDSRLPYPGLIRDLRKPNGNLDTNVLRQMQDQVFLSGTQWPRMDYQFPDGVALELAAGTIFDMNPHYVNRTDEVTTGEVHVNFEYADPAEVQNVARVLQLNNLDFVLPPRAITTVTKTFLADEALQVFQLFSHAHEHMLDFRVEMVGTARAGETVYLATDYEHPPILEVDPPLRVGAGEGFRLIATYDNWTDYPLSFGFRSEDEMMILFGYYFTESGKRSAEGGPFRAVD